MNTAAKQPGLAFRGARDILKELSARTLSAESVAYACLDRIAERDTAIHAWVALQPEAVIAQACALDRTGPAGWLHGIPMGVKDVFDTFDLPTRYGSPIYAGHQPQADAAAVALCREAGAVVLGKTATTEFANLKACETRNPHNPDYSPGGSSSGSAAAVADGMAYLALGTQTAGSIVRPAAFCGVVGYKPSFSLVPRAGVKSTCESLDTVGGFARCVEDVALLAATLTGDVRMLHLETDDRPRVGFLRTPYWDQVSEQAQAAIGLAARALSGAGARVADVNLDQVLAPLVQAQDDIMSFEIFRALSHERRLSLNQISPELQGVLDKGSHIRFEAYLELRQTALRSAAAINQVFDHYDVLLTPGALDEAPRFGQGTGDPLLCRTWTLLGLPCVALPCGTGGAGLPLGIQLVGRFGQDYPLLRHARWIEAQWPHP